MELLFTLLAGLFILLGTLITFKIESNKFVDFTISTAFSVMICLILFELLPEVTEVLNIIETIIYCLLGIGLLKILDLLFPHHHHDHKHDKNHHETLNHIALVSSVALILHNLIEGMAIYSTTYSSTHAGLLMMLGVGMHNIPMGMVIGTSLKDKSKTKSKTILLSLLVSLSTLFGGLLMLLFKNYFLNETVTSILLALTLGMLVFITLFELLPKLLCSKNKKEIIYGIIIGIITILVTLLLGHHH